MPIPEYQKIMLPLLKFAGDQKEHSLREATDVLADNFKLTDEEKNELLHDLEGFAIALQHKT